MPITALDQSKGAIPAYLSDPLGQSNRGIRVVLSSKWLIAAKRKDSSRFKKTLQTAPQQDPRANQERLSNPAPKQINQEVKHTAPKTVQRTKSGQTKIAKAPANKTTPPASPTHSEAKVEPFPLTETAPNQTQMPDPFGNQGPSTWETSIKAGSNRKPSVKLTHGNPTAKNSMSAKILNPPQSPFALQPQDRNPNISEENLRFRFITEKQVQEDPNLRAANITGLTEEDFQNLLQSPQLLRIHGNGPRFASNMRRIQSAEYTMKIDWTSCQTDNEIVTDGKFNSEPLANLHTQIQTSIKSGPAYVGQVRPGAQGKSQNHEPATIQLCALQTMLNHQFAWLQETFDKDGMHPGAMCVYCGYNPQEQQADMSNTNSVQTVFVIGPGSVPHKQSSHCGEIGLNHCGCGSGPLKSATYFTVVALPTKAEPKPQQSPKRKSLADLLKAKQPATPAQQQPQISNPPEDASRTTAKPKQRQGTAATTRSAAATAAAPNRGAAATAGSVATAAAALKRRKTTLRNHVTNSPSLLDEEEDPSVLHVADQDQQAQRIPDDNQMAEGEDDELDLDSEIQNILEAASDEETQ